MLTHPIHDRCCQNGRNAQEERLTRPRLPLRSGIVCPSPIRCSSPSDSSVTETVYPPSVLSTAAGRECSGRFELQTSRFLHLSIPTLLQIWKAAEVGRHSLRYHTFHAPGANQMVSHKLQRPDRRRVWHRSGLYVMSTSSSEVVCEHRLASRLYNLRVQLGE